MKQHEIDELVRLNKLVQEHGRWYGNIKKMAYDSSYNYSEAKRKLDKIEETHQEWISNNRSKMSRRLELLKKWKEHLAKEKDTA